MLFAAAAAAACWCAVVSAGSSPQPPPPEERLEARLARALYEVHSDVSSPTPGVVVANRSLQHLIEKKNFHLPHEQLMVLHKRQPLVREVLDANDNLRSIGLGTEFDFPSIVVIGDQSAGKSSVLEAISGVQLLRGSGVVTRAPIELRLDGNGDDECVARVEAEGASVAVVPCGELASALNETMRSALWSQQNTAPRNKHHNHQVLGVTDAVIRVRVTAAGVPDLTLVDLPGLARVAVQGQSADVPRLTKDLATKYIRSPNTIILVVVPCNADLATAEALQLAAEVDPDGKRTVGVLTKPDLMDPGTEHTLGDVLDGRVVSLREHGYFVVRNRGQRAIDNNMDLDAALREERAFFYERHQVFARLAREKHPGRFGVASLVRYLTKVLVQRIVAEIPALRGRVEDRILHESAALSALNGKYHSSVWGAVERNLGDAASRKAFLLQLTTDFTMSVRETTRGHYDMLPRESAERGFMADLLAHYRAFHVAVKENAPQVNSSSYDAAVRHAVATQHGRESFYGFPSYAIFATLVRDLVGTVNAPADKCASQVRARVLTMARAASADLFATRFPKLRRALDAIVKRLADERHADASRALDMLLEMQQHPFTQELVAPLLDDDDDDHDILAGEPEGSTGRFFGRASSTGEPFRPPNAKTQTPQQMPNSQNPWNNNNNNNNNNYYYYYDQPPVVKPNRRRTPTDAYAVEFVKAKIDRYFAILAERVGDLVPMAIDMYLVQRFGHDLALRVANATHAFTDAEISDLLRENADLARRRHDLEDIIAKLSVAREVIDDFSSAADVVADHDDLPFGGAPRANHPPL
ncbi:hypothetical protein CTAYLR_009566 [Chrysophaeum taylorii]|uniref:Uncharacterized protein n=1 Tax=Chrysophaeum taylorii TaxID=2483200 RepID=A0AAD7XNW0_9STRA|nr:hypothetical protein CTAYLR_009566 [Chrysophaeum taylorii]